MISVKFLDLGEFTETEPPTANTASAISTPLAIPTVATQPSESANLGPLDKPRPYPTEAPRSTLIEDPNDRVVADSTPEAGPIAKADPEISPPLSLLAGSSNPVTQATSEAPTVAAEEEAQASLNIEASEQAPTWVEHVVRKGDSLARIFADKGLQPSLLHRIVNSGRTAAQLANIQPGQTFRFLFDESHELVRLELRQSRVDSIRVSIDDEEVHAEEFSKDVETHIASAVGTIESSLFVDGQKAGLADGQIMELAGIFGWDIDFALEIRAGDSFRVLYEEHYLDGEKLRDGAILAAEFTNRGTTHTAVRYAGAQGEAGYFDANGNSKRRAFIRTPIKFARVSSGFNPRRWHPVLKKWRSHKGVDYAAPQGTPIKATGDGTVVFRGNKSGYGKTVIIEHAGTYTTLYAHMSDFSKRAREGQRVRQGQVIGYVGMTGLATGPHLHYEFRVNGQHRDPLRVKLPKSLTLAKGELPEFRKQTAPLLTQLAAIPTNTMVASAEDSSQR